MISEEIKNRHLDENSEPSPAELAEQLKALRSSDEEGYARALADLDAQSLGDVAVELPDFMVRDVIETVAPERLVEAIEELESDDATDLLQTIEEIDEERAKELFSSLEFDSQKEISKLINYADNEAGAYMQTELFSARSDELLGAALERFRTMKKMGEIENVFQLFIVDKDGVLKQSIPLEDLLMFDADTPLDKIISGDGDGKYRPHLAIDSDDISLVADIVKDYDLSSIAVVDRAGILLGRITTDDIHDFLEESATEQIYHLAGVDDEAEEEGLVKTGRARFFWLFLNLITAIASVSVIGFFNGAIEKLVVLAMLMPVVAGMGGNAGNQTLAVNVRRLALGEIGLGSLWMVLKKELAMAGVNSMIFAVLIGFAVGAWFEMPLLGLVLGLAMVINIVLAAFFGTVIPLSFKKINLDPAVGSTVILTTITDMAGFFVFLGLATLILL